MAAYTTTSAKANPAAKPSPPLDKSVSVGNGPSIQLMDLVKTEEELKEKMRALEVGMLIFSPTQRILEVMKIEAEKLPVVGTRPFGGEWRQGEDRGEPTPATTTTAVAARVPQMVDLSKIGFPLLFAKQPTGLRSTTSSIAMIDGKVLRKNGRRWMTGESNYAAVPVGAAVKVLGVECPTDLDDLLNAPCGRCGSPDCFGSCEIQ